MTNIKLQLGLNIAATSKKTGDVIEGFIQDMSHDGETMWVESNRDGFPQLFQFDTSLEYNEWVFEETKEEEEEEVSEWERVVQYAAKRVNGTVSYREGDDDYNMALIDMDAADFKYIASRVNEVEGEELIKVESVTLEIAHEYDMEQAYVSVNVNYSSELDFDTDVQLFEGEKTTFKLSNLKPHAGIKKAIRLAETAFANKIA